jgi:phytoene/squalene synthetase
MLRRLAPWLIAFEILRAGRDHWDQLDPGDRARVSALMRRTHGNPRNLTADDRRELTHLARQMRLGTLAASLVAAGVAGRRRHRRR